ncbi:MATE family efflux transporter [Anaerocolumna sp. MB42-C2]|uniref:MATE family efflux transporter n=1 Tax=Anaerocolumna sp. MB42-C2 TaxID=3070997 RepID=UPI0027E103DC|nr:MATE family efflux transporter [Anaerocolumna sp. MB42-C2]WMJ89634.1 MATE family efflux transporter [Anaerocolumna sp. MB42-C2]
MITDLTNGSPGKLLWKFSIPLLLSVMFQQLYSIVDSIVAGQYVGEDALAAIGASYPITMIFIAIATGSNIGCSVVISTLFGGKEYAKMKTAIFTSLISIFFISLFLTIVGLMACNPMLRLLDTPANIFSDASVFLRIYTGGLIFLLLYNICTGIFTSLGDSRTPFYFLLASSLLNILLDLIFVICFSMGVNGVAWATFTAQGIASVLSLITILRRIRSLPETKEYPRFSLSMLGRISKIAVPSILQQSFISFGNILIQKLINNYGSSVIAGYSAAIKLNTFAITSFTTLANGVSSFTAQNLGACKLERINKGFKSAILMCILVAVPFVIAYFGFGPGMMGLFLESSNGKAIVEGTNFLRITSPFYVIISIKLIADGVLRGSGSMRPFMIATFTDLILRVVLSYILSNFLGSIGIWLSWPIGWTIAAGLSFSFYAKGIWKKMIE